MTMSVASRTDALPSSFGDSGQQKPAGYTVDRCRSMIRSPEQ
jgi:hypothetical protein